MREKAVAEAVHRQLTTLIHKQSMTYASLSTNGTPDYWYEGLRKDMWIEYKARDGMPRDGNVIGEYTKDQLAWLTRRWKKRRNGGTSADVFGVVGLPNRTAVIQKNPLEWMQGTSVKTAISFKEVAEWIIEFCGG